MLFKNINWFREIYQPHKKVFSFVVIGSFIVAGLGLIAPMLIRYVMNDLLPLGITTELEIVSVILLTIYILSYYLNYKVECTGRTMGAKIEYAMREKLFKHMLQMGYSYYDNVQSGQLLSRIVNDISEVGNLMFAIPHLFITCSITLVGSVSLLFYLNVQLASIVTILLIIKTFQVSRMDRDMKFTFMKARENTGDLSAEVSETLQAIRLVKAFNTEELELKKMLNAGKNLLQVQEHSFKTVGKLHGGMDFFSNLLNLTITIIGGVLVTWEFMSMSDLVAFLLYMMICMRPVFELMMMTEIYQRGMAGVYRYRELMNLPEPINQEHKLRLPDKSCSIEFVNVNFSYDNGTNIFDNLNLKIAEGEHVGIVGMTGGGKTTLCELMLGMYPLNGGKILIDGQDITQIESDNLHRTIGMIQQDTFLFSATVKENIAYGQSKVTESAIKNAAILAEADEFINQLPNGYDTFIGERGVKLSGGQKQRLAIARMFLRNPKILILDEATSALDNETERLVQKAMNKLSENRTTITVAHRLATVQNSDRILVIDHGYIVEEGTQEELIHQKGIYYSLSRQ